MSGTHHGWREVGGPSHVPDRVVVIGVAEDGAVVRCSIAPRLLSSLDEHWPTMGLARPTGEHAANGLATADRHLLIGDPRGACEPTLAVDGTVGPGGWVRIESELALFAAEHLEGRIAVHAAVLAVGPSLIMLPGPSYTGKTTLSIALRDAGATLLSDEYAVVDPATGMVVGWDRPVHRRLPGGSVERIRLVESAPEQPVAVVASLRFVDGAPLHWEPMGQAAVVQTLMSNAVGARVAPDSTFSAALRIARSARGIHGVRAEAAEALVDLVAPRPH